MRPRCGNNNKIQLYIEVKFSCQNFKVREQRRGHEQAEEGNCSFKETVGRFACSYDWTYTGKPKLKGIQVFVLVYFAPCNVIRIPESREHLLVVSEIQKALACGIRNPLSWNLESSTWVWSPHHGIWNPRLSRITLHGAIYFWLPHFQICNLKSVTSSL